MSTVICGAMTSMNEHSEEDNLKDHSIEDILVRAEVMLNDTFQPRKLMGLSNTCKAALKDQRKSNMRKAVDLMVEEEYACTKTTMGSLECKEVQRKKKSFIQTVKQE